ncbi:MAG: hypothetical protein MZV63_52315 [Marinilabiliales bacterium]|nr:hypothetical protein [Marinilabiliales bacterium]
MSGVDVHQHFAAVALKAGGCVHDLHPGNHPHVDWRRCMTSAPLPMGQLTTFTPRDVS